jgi:hypothetical protein
VSSRQGEQQAGRADRSEATKEVTDRRSSRQEVQQAAAGRKGGRQQRAATSEKLKNELQGSSD